MSMMDVFTDGLMEALPLMIPCNSTPIEKDGAPSKRKSNPQNQKKGQKVVNIAEIVEYIPSAVNELQQGLAQSNRLPNEQFSIRELLASNNRFSLASYYKYDKRKSQQKVKTDAVFFAAEPITCNKDFPLLRFPPPSLSNVLRKNVFPVMNQRGVVLKSFMGIPMALGPSDSKIDDKSILGIACAALTNSVTDKGHPILRKSHIPVRKNARRPIYPLKEKKLSPIPSFSRIPVLKTRLHQNCSHVSKTRRT